MQTYHTRRFIIPVLCLAASLSAAGIDLYTPSLPWMMIDLHAGERLAKLTIPFYTYGFAAGALLFGILSDAWGRKTSTATGLIAYIFVSLLCASSSNVYWLLFFRFLQGVAGAAVFINYRAVLADVFVPVKKVHHAMASIAIVFSIVPVIAPVIGGYVQHFLGWRANFIFLAVFGVLVLGAFMTLPETHRQRVPIRRQKILTQYGKVLRAPLFWVGVLLMNVVCIGLTFTIVSSFLIQDVMHYNAVVFGHTALFLGLCFFGGSYTYRFLLRRFDIAHIMIVGVIMAGACALIFFVLAVTLPVNFWRLVIPTGAIFFFIACAGLYPAGAGICAGLFPETAGATGAVVGVVYHLTLASAVSFSSLLATQSAVPLALFCLAALAIFLALSILCRRAIGATHANK